MALSNQIGAYKDCFEVLDIALSDPKGARAVFTREPDANLFMFRCHQARSLDRAEAKRMYPPDNPAWGKSAYDVLVVRKPRQETDAPDRWWVYIEHHGADITVVEALSDAAPLALNPPKNSLLARQPMKTITAVPMDNPSPIQIEIKRRV